MEEGSQPPGAEGTARAEAPASILQNAASWAERFVPAPAARELRLVASLAIAAVALGLAAAWIWWLPPWWVPAGAILAIALPLASLGLALPAMRDQRLGGGARLVAILAALLATVQLAGFMALLPLFGMLVLMGCGSPPPPIPPGAAPPGAGATCRHLAREVKHDFGRPGGACCACFGCGCSAALCGCGLVAPFCPGLPTWLRPWVAATACCDSFCSGVVPRCSCPSLACVAQLTLRGGPPTAGGDLRVAAPGGTSHKEAFAHHPDTPRYAEDVFLVRGARLCVGCFTTYPVFIAMLTVAMAIAVPWHLGLALGLGFASLQAISSAGLARRRVLKVTVKACLGTGLALAVHGVLAAPWPDLVQWMLLAGLLALAGLSALPRARRMRREAAAAVASHA